jgi:hypothetical protein
MVHLVNRPDVGEINGLSDGLAYHRARPVNARRVCWTTPHLRVTRLRLLSDRGFPAWDVSYCHGTIVTTGEQVDVELPFDQLPKRGMRRAIVQHAIRDNVHAHGIGVLGAISTLN